MSPTITIIFTVLVLKAAVHASPHSPEKHDKSHKVEKHTTCQEFGQGVTFNDSQAIGFWYMLHHGTKITTDSHCVQFSPVNEQERKDLNDLVGKYVENLKWERLTMKMLMPCPSITSNGTSIYYLEKLEDDGSYRTLQLPPTTAKLDLADFQRHSMRLKIIEGQYLGMMDCRDKYVFFLSRQTPEGQEIPPRMKKIIEAYWPEE